MTKTPTRTKKFYYRRVSWQSKDKSTLEKMLKNAHSQFKTAGERTFLKTDGEVQGASYKIEDKHRGIYLHIGVCKPGESASVIDGDKTLAESNTDEHPAPEGKEFLDGEIFAYVRKNHIIFCTTNLQETILKFYLRKILGKCGFTAIEQTLELHSIARTNTIKMIKNEGIKSIDLNMSLYDASMLRLEKKEKKSHGLYTALVDQLETIFAQDPDHATIEEMENVNVKLSLTFDGTEAHRNRKKQEFGIVGKKHLELAASEIINDYDPDSDLNENFVILTNEDNKIYPSQIQVSTKIKVNKIGKSVSKIDAWKHLRIYYNDLKSTGVLNQ